ncbi:AI-2E family transporter [Bacillus cereus]|uniref:AI-2E family transporter n=1 Tax=Bacillus cereus TaxID=1396 RepID=UPI00159621EB|nr:AI-2E family transporter [Bacillus cereus]
MLVYFKKHWKNIINIGLFIGCLFLFFYLLKISFIYATPIYIAMLFYAMYRPCIKLLTKKGFSYKTSVSLSILTVSLILVGTIVSIGTVLYFQTQNAIQNFPQWLDWSQQMIHQQIMSLKSQINHVPDSLSENAKEQLESISQNAIDWTYGLISTIFTNVSIFSKFIIQIAIGYVLSIFLTFEWPTLKKFLIKNIPDNAKTFLTALFGDTAKGLGGYIKAQLILVTCTFLIVWVSLEFLGIGNALLLAFISGVIDVLPLLGTPAFFIPWVLYLLLVGQTSLAIKLTVLCLIIVSFRQVMEPRLTGNSLGISPFIMLAGMVTSVSVLGFIGLILAPIILVVIRSLWVKGYFQLWLFGNLNATNSKKDTQEDR